MPALARLPSQVHVDALLHRHVTRGLSVSVLFFSFCTGRMPLLPVTANRITVRLGQLVWTSFVLGMSYLVHPILAQYLARTRALAMNSLCSLNKGDGTTRAACTVWLAYYFDYPPWVLQQACTLPATLPRSYPLTLTLTSPPSNRRLAVQVGQFTHDFSRPITSQQFRCTTALYL